MAIIYTRDFAADGTRPYLLLGGEEFVRPLGIGSNWTVLRVTMAVAFWSRGDTGNPANNNWWMGFCSGTSRTVASNNTGHWVGILRGESNTGANALICSLVYAANSGLPYYTLSSGGYRNYGAKVNNSWSIPGYVSGGDQVRVPINDVGATPRKAIVGLQIEKTAPTYFTTRDLGYLAATAVNVSFDKVVAFHEEQGLNHTVDGVTANFSNASNGTFPATDEAANGYLDTFNFYWSSSTRPLEIYSIAISRQA